MTKPREKSLIIFRPSKGATGKSLKVSLMTLSKYSICFKSSYFTGTFSGVSEP